MEQNQFNMCEKDVLMDMLSTQKSLMSMYSLEISESVSPELRNTLDSLFSTVSSDQYKLWNLMNQQGFYQVENAEVTKLDQEKQKATQLKNSLN